MGFPVLLPYQLYMHTEPYRPKKKYQRYRHRGVRPGRTPGTFILSFMDHNGRRRQKTFHGTESEAAKVRRHLLAKIDKIKYGLEPAPEKVPVHITLSQLWEEFYAAKQVLVASGTMAPKSLERYRHSLYALYGYNALLVDTKLEELTTDDLEKFKVSRVSSGYSPVGVNTNIRNLRTLLGFAVKKGYLQHNPFKDAKFIPVRKKDVRFLNDREVTALNLALEGLDMNDEFQKDAKDLVLFYLFSGARASEALWPTFNFSCIQTDSILFPETKGSRSRNIPLLASLRAVLDRRRQINNGPFPFTIYMVYNRVKYVLRTAGIDDASTHTLRKTAGAWYYMATRDIFATSRFLGHSSVNVTEQHYAGLIESLQVRYAQKFEDSLQSFLTAN